MWNPLQCREYMAKGLTTTSFSVEQWRGQLPMMLLLCYKHEYNQVLIGKKLCNVVVNGGLLEDDVYGCGHRIGYGCKKQKNGKHGGQADVTKGNGSKYIHG